MDILADDTLKQIAEKYDKTPGQIVLRWNLQNNVLPIVKASSPKHQEENLDVFDFELTDEDIQAIDAMDKGEEGRVEGQHPNEYEEFV